MTLTALLFKGRTLNHRLYDLIHMVLEQGSSSGAEQQKIKTRFIFLCVVFGGQGSWG